MKSESEALCFENNILFYLPPNHFRYFISSIEERHILTESFV